MKLFPQSFMETLVTHPHCYEKTYSDKIDNGVDHSIFCSVLEKRLTELHSECHWVQSVSWQLCGQCTLPCLRKALNTRTGKCLWHSEQGCSHDDCAHYIPVTTSPFHCPDARGTYDLQVTPTWIHVSANYILHLVSPHLLVDCVTLQHINYST